MAGIRKKQRLSHVSLVTIWFSNPSATVLPVSNHHLSLSFCLLTTTISINVISVWL
jgi:hypothetical protein